MVTPNPFENIPAYQVTETHTCFELDHRLEQVELFRVHKEVPGEYIQPRPGLNADERGKGCRIDRLLLPTPKLMSLGWAHGAIGIECKAPEKRLGPALCQCLDYSRAAFPVPNYGVKIILSWVFLWPMASEDLVGDIASIMDQNRVGACVPGKSYTLQFKTASRNLLTVNKTTGVVELGNIRQGGKVGSR